MKYQLKVVKFGDNDYGKWCVGQLTNGVLFYNGIFRIDGDTELSQGLIVNVKSIIVGHTEKGKLTIRVVL